MQIKYLPQAVYKIYPIAARETIQSQHLKQRKKFLGDWEILKARKVPDKKIAKITGISRTTYYRLKQSLRIYGIRGLEIRSRRPKRVRQSKIPKQTVDAVLKIRLTNPTYGKEKIGIILKRDFGISLSASTVGRLIKSFIQKGLVITSYSYVRKKRKRIFKGHAKRWQYGMLIERPGVMVQVDHMTVTKNQLHFKHGSIQGLLNSETKMSTE